jgi:chemotaxis protein methyltransferase CheR
MSAAFEVFAEVLRARSGLEIQPDRSDIVAARLMPLVRRLGLTSLDALADALGANPDDPLADDLVEAMASADTAFFRDRALFANLRSTVLPRLIALKTGTRSLRLWSAGCSTGQEPYSLAMALLPQALLLGGWDVEIVGTDLSERFLAKARSGLYSHYEVQRGLPVQLLLQHFRREDEAWRLSDIVRRHVRFERANLLEDVPALGAFDLILCRNVLDRFAAGERARAVERLMARLAPAGVLVLGEGDAALAAQAGLSPLADVPGAFRRPGPTLRVAG